MDCQPGKKAGSLPSPALPYAPSLSLRPVPLAWD